MVDEEPSELNGKFLDTIYGFIVGQEAARANFVLAKGCCGFVHEAAKQLCFFKERISPLFAYLLDVFRRYSNI